MTQTPDPFSSPEPPNRFGRWALALGAAVILGGWIWSTIDQTAAPERPQPLLTSQTEAAVVAPADTDPMDTWIDWRSDQGPADRRIGGYRIQASSTVRADGLYVPRLQLTDAAGLTTEVSGEGAAYSASAAFAVVKLDPGDTASQVLVSSFTGGAHCCSVLSMAESRDGQWRVVDLGSWDGDSPAMPRDLDGDGVKEFQFVDQAFLYAFASYAESWAPPVVRKVTKGQVQDVSKAAAFRGVFVRDAVESRKACLERSNGACAAYVASAARAGRLDTAWAEMLGAYDQASDWILPKACRVRTAGACPAGAEMTFSTYPEALQWFLGEHGYADKAYVEPLNATGPSYNCGAARTVSEQAICRSPNLSVLDRTLAVAYSRASALSRDRAALRESQRAFRALRRDEASESALAALYERRIGELLSID